MIDDEYGKGIRLKKTKDGYEEVDETETGETAEEIAFAFPYIDTDDEELVGLSPEEALALIKSREEEAKARKVEYERICAEGEELLTTGNFKTAQLKFENALQLDDEAVLASVGYWRAKTENFAHPEILMDEYVDSGLENLEFDLGCNAVDVLKEKYQDVFQNRYKALCEEEKPLAKEVEEAQDRRRVIIKERLKKSAIAFAVNSVITTAFLVLTVVFALLIPSTRENVHLIPACVCGGLFTISLIFSIITTNKFINDCRIQRLNEDVTSTEEGERLQTLRNYKELYAGFLIDDEK